MDILKLNITQRKLRNPEQVKTMLNALEEGKILPPVILAEFEDGSIQIENGHHRCFAYWLSGRTMLNYGEYILVQKENNRRPRFGSVVKLAISL